MNKLIYIVLAILIIFVLGMAVLSFLTIFKSFYAAYDNKNSTGGSFENQWISFNYPSNLTIEDVSNDDHIYIKIYNGTERIGKIYDEGVNIDRYGPLSESSYTTINGRKTLKDYDVEDGSNGEVIIQPSAAIKLTEDTTLNIIFKPEGKKTFNNIINTLNIKKEDVKPDLSEKLQNTMIKEGPQNTFSTGGKFENNWIKFEYPKNFTVTDSSDDNRIQITIMNGNELVGDITTMSGLSTISSIPENQSFFTITSGSIPDNTTIIAGRKAKTNTSFNSEFKPMPSANIELNPNATLALSFQPNTETTYYQVIKTLKIKNDTIIPNVQSDSDYFLQNFYESVKFSILSFISNFLTFFKYGMLVKG